MVYHKIVNLSLVKVHVYHVYHYLPSSLLVGKDHNYEMSMLVIGLTEEESIKVQQESWDHGVGDTCTPGRGRIL